MIFEILPEGQENSMSKKTLCDLLGISPDHLRVAIARERAEGKLILSSVKSGHGGYFRPKNIEELERFVSTESHRARSIFLMIKPMRIALKRGRLKEQHNGESIFDLENDE